jgi:hypothetical protein
MLKLPRDGRLPLSRAFLVGCALSVVAAVARADDVRPNDEWKQARTEMTATLSRMALASHRVQDLLRAARKDGANRDVTCLDEALSRAHAARRNAVDETASALAAYEVGDVSRARASRGRIAELEAAQRLAVQNGLACKF